MTLAAFMTWLRLFAAGVEDGAPTAAQWVEVFATLARVQHRAADPRVLQIHFHPGGAVRTTESRLSGCAL